MQMAQASKVKNVVPVVVLDDFVRPPTLVRAQPLAPNCHDAHLQTALPAFHVLHQLGFLTALGCVCALPLITEGDEAKLLVCVNKVKLAAKVLGAPLRKHHTDALKLVGEYVAAPLNVEDDYILLSPRVVRKQWDRLREGNHGCAGVSNTIEDRRRIAERFKIFAKRQKGQGKPATSCPSSAKAKQNTPIREVARVAEILDTWFAVPLPSDVVSPQDFQRLCHVLDVHYDPRAHYGFEWRPCNNSFRECADIVISDQKHQGSPDELSFVLDCHVPGAALALTRSEHSEHVDTLLQLRARRASSEPDVFAHRVSALLQLLAQTDRMSFIACDFKGHSHSPIGR